MKILITGCAGFIGSHLCEKLLKDKSNKIIGIDIITENYDINQKLENLEILEEYDNFKFKKVDILDTNIINNEKPDIVVHLAASTGIENSLENPTNFIRNNIEGHTNLLDQSVKNDVKLFIYASSSSVYGNNEKVPFSEEDKIENLNSPYALTKFTCENFSKLYNKLYNIPVIGLRFFTVYGPRGIPDLAPYKFLSKIINNEEIIKYEDDKICRNYTYIDDVVNGIIGAIKNKNNKKCEIYNLRNIKTYSLNELIDICKEVTEKNAINNNIKYQKEDESKTYSDIKKAKEDLDYNPVINLTEGLRNMFEWLKEYKKIVFDIDTDKEIKKIINNREKVKNYNEYKLKNKVIFDESQLKNFFEIDNNNLIIMYSKSMCFDYIIISNYDNKYIIDFCDNNYELKNKELNNSIELKF